MYIQTDIHTFKSHCSVQWSVSHLRTQCVKVSGLAGALKAVRLQRGAEQHQKPLGYWYKWPNTSHKATQKTAQVNCLSNVFYKYSGAAALAPPTANEVCRTDHSWTLLLHMQASPHYHCWELCLSIWPEVLLIVLDWSCPSWRTGCSVWMQHTDPKQQELYLARGHPTTFKNIWALNWVIHSTSRKSDQL